MSSTSLPLDSLVRYESGGNWRFATLRRETDGQVLEIEYLSGESEQVPRDRVLLFTDYLASRQRVLSLTRESLCQAFYGRALQRLTNKQINEMQSILRRHGLAFNPAKWPPDARIRIERDESVVLEPQEQPDPHFEDLLPRWLAPQKLPPSSRDPLGLQAHAERIADRLLPGLTVFTTRAGYYGFLAWAIQRLNTEQLAPPQRRLECLYRLERALALCEFIHHGAKDNSCSLIGQRSKTRILQSADSRDRFCVPRRIMRNQSSAGAFRLYSSALVKAGLAVEMPELGVQELLPFELTHELGASLARYFARRVPGSFWDFALSDRSQSRDTLREWGKQLCFSRLDKRYRDTLYRALFLDNREHAEARYATVLQLFKHELLGEEEEEEAAAADEDYASSEEEAVAQEEVPPASGLSNDKVLLHFYEQPPRHEYRHFQVAAVFELLSLGLSALFALATEALRENGRCRLSALAAHVAEETDCASLWSLPRAEAGRRAPPARELLKALLSAETSASRASYGGALVAQVLASSPLAAVGSELADTPVISLASAVPAQSSLRDAFPSLLEAMVARHEQVSVNKGRQRWCYIDRDELVKDNLQPMSVRLHAMRFPQLASLCRDLELTREDLDHAT